MKQLDLTPLFALYLGAGVTADPSRFDIGCGADRNSLGTGVKPKTMLVDAGYVTACNLAICDQAGIALYGPWQENDFSRKNQKPGAKPRPSGKEHFTWVSEQNTYRCREGHAMPWMGNQSDPRATGRSTWCIVIVVRRSIVGRAHGRLRAAPIRTAAEPSSEANMKHWSRPTAQQMTHTRIILPCVSPIEHPSCTIGGYSYRCGR